nr:precorrin-8X methylmutase [uncultured Holophaga sp.]
MNPLIHNLMANPMSGEDIERASFAAIDREAPVHGLDAGQWGVARRMVHTCADFSILQDLVFHAGAVEAGIAALRGGAPIYTDANMIRSGLSQARLKAVYPDYSPQDIRCHVADPEVAEEARRTGLPRSLFAIRKAKDRLHGGIVGIGNAPVALLELNRMIVEEGIRPALVIAMPVGFVHVVESKDEVLSLDVPVIALKGRRGGSPLVVATIHALAVQAKELK